MKHETHHEVASGENLRTGLSSLELKKALLDNLNFAQARIPEFATRNDWYMAVAYTVRDRMLDDWLTSLSDLRTQGVKVRQLPFRGVPDGAAPRQQSPESGHYGTGQAGSERTWS